MSLTDKVAADLIAAMKAKDTVSLEAIRAAKTAFILARSEKGAGSVLMPDEELKIIQKLVKQRRESAEIFREQKRPDLYEKEEAELIYRRGLSEKEWEYICYNLKTKLWPRVRKEIKELLEYSPDAFIKEV